MSDTEQLLRRYADENSEDAFGQLVSRYVNLVYSTALRQVAGDAHLAQDIAQTVFADLARKARTLPRGVVLAGWLHRHTCFIASKAVRTERRRRTREREAAEMNATNEPESAWQQIAPLLDDALNGLASRDRDLLVLRYFEGQNLRTLGTALGTNEDAAQKRVSRALERLRSALAHRGVALSATALAAALGGQALGAAPVGLAATLSSAALAGVTAGGSALTFFKIMTMTKMKLAVITTVVAAGVATPLVIQHQSLKRLREENRAVREQMAQAQSAPRANDLLAQTQVDLAEQERLNKEHLELLRLRGEVTQLRTQEKELAKLRAATQRAANTPTLSAAKPDNNELPKDSWTDAGFATPQAALQTRGWAVQNGNRERFKESVVITDGARKLMEQMLDKMITGAPDPDKARQQIRAQGLSLEDGILFPMMAENSDKGYTGYRILSQSSSSADELVLEVETGMTSAPAKQETMKFQRVGNDWKAIIDEDLIRSASHGGAK